MLEEPLVFEPPVLEAVTNITLVFVCQEIHPLADHKVVKADAQRLKELLGELIQRCRQECGTPEMLVERRGLS